MAPHRAGELRLDIGFNPNASITTRWVGPSRHRVVIVDDFLADPERVRAIADHAIYSTAPELLLDFPGERALIAAETVGLRRQACDYLGGPSEPLDQSYPLTISRSYTTVELEPSQRQPHRDPTFVGLIYLNRGSECVGGTALYGHRPTGRDYIPAVPDASMIRLAHNLGYHPEEWRGPTDYEQMVRNVFFNEAFANPENETVNEGNQYWELLELVEMKFNRLVLFDGQIPHTEYTPRNSFDDTPRTVQLLSIPFPNDALAPIAA